MCKLAAASTAGYTFAHTSNKYSDWHVGCWAHTGTGKYSKEFHFGTHTEAERTPLENYQSLVCLETSTSSTC